MTKIMMTTQDRFDGFEISECLGVVIGNTVRAATIGQGMFGGLKSLIGGEIGSFTEVVQEARQEAIHRMTEEAIKLGADAVVGFRMMTAEVMQTCSEIVAYGTAVKLAK